MKGGTGRTTVSANLAVQLHRMGRRVLVVDTDPQNALGLHLGMSVGERFGLALPEMTEAEIAAYHRRNPIEVPHLPFGHCTAEQVLDFTRLQFEDPEWFTRRVQQATPPDTELMIIDSPPMVSTWTQEIINTVDFVLVVLAPDGASYATIPATQELLSESTRPHGEAYLINRMDARPPPEP